MVISFLKNAIKNGEPFARVENRQIHSTATIGLVDQKSMEEMANTLSPVGEEDGSTRKNDFLEELGVRNEWRR